MFMCFKYKSNTAIIHNLLLLLIILPNCLPFCYFVTLFPDVTERYEFSHLPAEVVSGSAIGLQQLAGQGVASGRKWDFWYLSTSNIVVEIASCIGKNCVRCYLLVLSVSVFCYGCLQRTGYYFLSRQLATQLASLLPSTGILPRND